MDQSQIQFELLFIPAPGRGHLSAALEMANLLVRRDQRLSVTVLLITTSFDPKSTSHSDSHPNIRTVDITHPDSAAAASPGGVSQIINFIDTHKSRVRAEATKIGRPRLAGFVVDLFSTGMIDVADEFSVPAYVFFTSGAVTMGLILHFQALADNQNRDIDEWISSTDEILVPTYEHLIPVKVLPSILVEKDSRDVFASLARNLRRAKGIVANTFREMELRAMRILAEDKEAPPVYPVGPILHEDSEDSKKPKHREIMKWLDGQPESSVVFLCFGSRGCFDEVQVKEISVGLERSGVRFLWSLRKPPSEGNREAPGEYEDPREVLPEGFIQRTAEIGKVIGWAPQVAVLAHGAVGGFVSHCGWNSTLESVWCGVPMAVWPLFAEQSLNAFQMVKELGVAVEINMEYKSSEGRGNMIVRANVIESGIRRLMEPESDIRVKIEGLKVKSRAAVEENGSSFESVGRFVSDVIDYMT